MFLYAGENFGQPNWFGAIDTSSGKSLWQVPFETVDGHNELGWSNEAAFSPAGSVAYFTTRVTSNGAPGRLWAVRIAETTASPADLTGPVGVPDGCVDAFDLGAMLGAWCSAVNDPNPPSPPCENCTPANLALADISGAANLPDG